MARMVNRVCRCGKKFQARASDVKRGWGKFCSKKCKAIEQEGRTHQYAELKDNNANDTGLAGEIIDSLNRQKLEGTDGGWDAHKYESGSINNDKD